MIFAVASVVGMRTRRCTLAKGRTPRFRIEEVGNLLGDVTEQAVRASKVPEFLRTARDLSPD